MWTYLTSWLPSWPRASVSNLAVDDFYDLAKPAPAYHDASIICKWLDAIASQETNESERSDLLNYLVASKDTLSHDALRNLQERLLEMDPALVADHFVQLFGHGMSAVLECREFIKPTAIQDVDKCDERLKFVRKCQRYLDKFEGFTVHLRDKQKLQLVHLFNYMVEQRLRLWELPEFYKTAMTKLAEFSHDVPVLSWHKGQLQRSDK